MTGQLSLLLGGLDVEPVAWPATRRLPLLRNHLRVVAQPSERRVSRVCRPGYHKGRRPGNAGKRFPAEILTQAESMVGHFGL